MSVLGVDIGTTGCKAGAFSADGRLLGSAYREYETVHPQPDWAEVDSADVWAKAKAVIAEVAAQTAADPITALCSSSMAEAVVPVTADRETPQRQHLTGRPKRSSLNPQSMSVAIRRSKTDDAEVIGPNAKKIGEKPAGIGGAKTVDVQWFIHPRPKDLTVFSCILLKVSY